MYHSEVPESVHHALFPLAMLQHLAVPPSYSWWSINATVVLVALHERGRVKQAQNRLDQCDIRRITFEKLRTMFHFP